MKIYDLTGALIFEGTDLREADLRGADLRGADLEGADLRGANLEGANLGEKDILVYIEHPSYPLTFLTNSVQAGCQIHSPQEWLEMTRDGIYEMDKDKAIHFYPTLVRLIKAIYPELA